MGNSNVEVAFDNLKDVHLSVDEMRAKLINKTFNAAMQVDITSDIGASLLESRMGVISAADALMKSREAAASAQVKLAIADKSADAAEGQNELVAGLLRTINLTDKPPMQTEGHTTDIGSPDLKHIDEQITEGEIEATNISLEEFGTSDKDE